MITSLRFAQRLFFSNRAQSVVRRMAWISLVSTFVAVAALIIVQSVMNGFNANIHKRLLSHESHLTLRSVGVDNLVQIQEAIRNVSHIDQAVRVVPYRKQDAILRTVEGRYWGSELKAIPPDAMNSLVEQSESNEGPAYYSGGNTVIADNEVVLGEGLARALKTYEGNFVFVLSPEMLLLPEGEIPRGQRFLVKGIFALGSDNMDMRTVFYSNSKFHQQFESIKSTEFGVDVWFSSVDNVLRLKSELQKRLPQVQVLSWQDKNEAMMRALLLEKIATMTFLALGVLITCYSIVSTLGMLLSQKRKDIGVLMTMGMSKSKVRNLFLGVGMVLSSVGMFGGLAFGVGLSLIMEKYPIVPMPRFYQDVSLPSRVDFIAVAVIFAVVGCIGFLAAYLPVRAYVRNSPSDNIKGT